MSFNCIECVGCRSCAEPEEEVAIVPAPRATRRKHDIRIKRNRGKRLQATDSSPQTLGMLLHTSTPCSCPMCGNPRKIEGASRKERLQSVKLKEGILEYQELSDFHQSMADGQ